MSEFTTSKEFQDFKDSVSAFHTTTRESFLGLEFNVNKIMTNELVHVQADLKELKTSFNELNKSIVPFVQRVNDALNRIDEKDKAFEIKNEKFEKRFDSFDKFVADQNKKFNWLAGVLAVIVFIFSVFGNEIKNIIFK